MGVEHKGLDGEPLTMSGLDALAGERHFAGLETGEGTMFDLAGEGGNRFGSLFILGFAS